MHVVLKCCQQGSVDLCCVSVSPQISPADHYRSAAVAKARLNCKAVMPKLTSFPCVSVTPPLEYLHCNAKIHIYIYIYTHTVYTVHTVYAECILNVVHKNSWGRHKGLMFPVLCITSGRGMSVLHRVGLHHPACKLRYYNTANPGAYYVTHTHVQMKQRSSAYSQILYKDEMLSAQLTCPHS